MSIPIFLLTIGFILFCAYMARHAVVSYKRAKKSHHWPSTEGFLVDVKLWGRRNIDGEMIEAKHLSVAYEYSINGVQHSGTEVSFCQLHYPETIEFAKAHPKDSRVTVFYNPENFSESVLVSGVHPTKPYGGLILAFFGVFISVAVSIGVWTEVLK